MQITKTINDVSTGDITLMPEVTIDITARTLTRGVTFDGETVSCQVPLDDVFADMEITEMDVVSVFINKATAMAVNATINPDTPLIPNDIEWSF